MGVDLQNGLADCSSVMWFLFRFTLTLQEARDPGRPMKGASRRGFKARARRTFGKSDRALRSSFHATDASRPRQATS
jgi:hypothetical protein